MKAKLLTAVAFVLLPITPAMANDEGAWVKVDSNGNAVGQAIVCTSDVCGNPDSLYNKMTLAPGERYVLQFAADPVTGNVAGMGANQGAGDVKVNLETGEWTATQINTYELPRIDKAEPIITKTEKVVQSWQSGAQTTDRVVNVEPVVIEPKKQSFGINLDWDLLISLGFEDLIRWLMQYFDGIVIP